MTAVVSDDTLSGSEYLSGTSTAAREVVREEIDSADALMTRWHGRRSPQDRATRRVELADAVASLQEARKPLTEIRKRLPYGPARNTHPAAVLDTEATKTLRKLRSMLARCGSDAKSGTNPGRTAPVVSRQSMHGTIARTTQELNGIHAELMAMQPLLVRRNFPRFRRMEVAAEAKALIPRIEAARDRLNLAWRRYDLDHPTRRAAAAAADESEWKVKDADEALLDQVVVMRDGARRLRGIVLDLAKAPKAPQRRWTPDDVIASWIEFHAGHDRWPTTRDHRTNKALPHHTQLRRTMGPEPLATTLAAVKRALE